MFAIYSIYAIIQVMQWKIVYYNEKLEEDIFQLSDTLLAKFIRLT